ncbi:MAG TPA: hypothetical protein VGF39_07285, partial [Stellaceae bacterium]
MLEPPYHPYTRMLLDWAADNEPRAAGTPTAPAGAVSQRAVPINWDRSAIRHRRRPERLADP